MEKKENWRRRSEKGMLEFSKNVHKQKVSIIWVHGIRYKMERRRCFLYRIRWIATNS